MKKHIFGLGIMFVGAVLMFVFMNGQVNAMPIQEQLRLLKKWNDNPPILEGPTEITGAFGLTLNGTLTLASILKMENNRLTKHLSYLENTKYLKKVKPPTPNKLFQSYYVTATPSSETITGIHAVRSYSSVDQCFFNHKKLRDGLEKKYGNYYEDGKGLIPSARTSVWRGYEYNHIRITCSHLYIKGSLLDLDKIYLIVTYSLPSKVRKEMIDKELFAIDPLDPSGL